MSTQPDTGFIAGLTLAILAIPASAGARDLLVGEVGVGEERLPFLVTGESRKEIIGGSILLGDREFTIARVSVHGLIGGARYGRTQGNKRFGEYIILSSSFSEQTAIGQPWVSADRYVNCESAYNTFLALYRVIGEAQIATLGESPYKLLTDDPAASDESEVFCFNSRRPEPPAAD